MSTSNLTCNHKMRRNITWEMSVDFHIRLSAQLLCYMTAEQAFATVEEYLDTLDKAYEKESSSISKPNGLPDAPPSLKDFF